MKYKVTVFTYSYGSYAMSVFNHIFDNIIEATAFAYERVHQAKDDDRAFLSFHWEGIHENIDKLIAEFSWKENGVKVEYAS